MPSKWYFLRKKQEDHDIEGVRSAVHWLRMRAVDGLR